jgi:hypothetical protein
MFSILTLEFFFLQLIEGKLKDNLVLDFWLKSKISIVFK